MKQLFLPILGAAAFIIIVGLMYNNKLPLKSPESNKDSSKNNIVIISDNHIEVEIADSSDERSKGLSGRDNLDEGKGMLFVLDQKNTRPGFWMKGMKMPIDIIWINDEKIIQIDSEVPYPDENANEFPSYFPKSDIDYVLEVPSGYSNNVGIKEGDQVKLPSPY